MKSCRIHRLSIGGRDNPPVIMGVINISPESFYQPSFIPPHAVRERCLTMVDSGASIIDLGARSTAPGSLPISARLETERITEALRHVNGSGVTLSIDTMHPEVFSACLRYDIHALNDIRGLCDPLLTDLASSSGIPVIAMASSSAPGDAVSLGQTHENLKAVRMRAQSAGIKNLVLDPGIGAWHTERSSALDWEICRNFSDFLQYSHPLLAAVSRKSFIGSLLHRGPEDRLAGSLAVTADLLAKGASLIRAHDIPETTDLLKVFATLR